MKFKTLVFIAFFAIGSAAAEAKELTRVYHNGKPGGATPSTLMTEEMASETAVNYQDTGKIGRRVWTYSKTPPANTYSRYDLLRGRNDVDFYIRSSRAASRALINVTTHYDPYYFSARRY